MTFIADQLMVKLAKDLQIRAAGQTVTHGEEWKCGCLRFQERTVAEVHDRRSRILYHLALSELVGPNATPLHFGWWLPFFAFHLLSAAATGVASIRTQELQGSGGVGTR